MQKLAILLLLNAIICFPSFAQTNVENTEDVNLLDLSLEDLLDIKTYDEQFKLYGFINSNVEKVFKIPSLDNEGRTLLETDPISWSPVQNFHIYGSGNVSSNISLLFNLAYEDEAITIRNAYGNFKLKELWQIRVGKMYRKFGLYNEKLDQIPTFMGIEPPELLDKDHLFLQRTTNLMLHGNYEFTNSKLAYALSTDNGEGGASKNVIPLGWDLRYTTERKGLVIGTSGYSSSINGERTSSTVSLGSGSPAGGILPWMSSDNFIVLGGFIEKQINNLLIQSAYWQARHKALRDPEGVLTLLNEAGINRHQRENFLGNNADVPTRNLTTEDVLLNANYTVSTFYVRVGYSIKSNIGQFMPYVFFDMMSNPEVIQNKSYGGDNETGLSDDGKFNKSSAGIVYRPIKTVAVKFDVSTHTQKFNGVTNTYPEARLDFSFSFDALSNRKQ